MSNRPFFSDPRKIAQFDRIEATLQDLLDITASSVRADRESNESFFARVYPLISGVFLASLLLVLWRLLHFRRKILVPIQTLIHLIEQFHAGDTSARWPLDYKDEIGDAGKTMDHLFAELSQRRRERINFIGSVAHDIRNPLTAIEMNCELLLRGKEKLASDQALGMIQRIKADTTRLQQLTEDLLVAAKENRPVWLKKDRRFNLERLANEVLASVKGSGDGHRYSFVNQAGTVELFADPGRIAQVLTNLLSNAAKYSARDTEIETVIGSLPSGYFIEIRDHGVGVPDEKKREIFQPFSRLAAGMEMSGGTGLGLVIVKDIVESYAGTIRVLDREGGGAIFRVELPLSSLRKEEVADHRRAS